jgi:hypothetical protein
MTEQERQLHRNIQQHDLAESYRLRRAKLAKEAGLPVEQFATPLPGNTLVDESNIQQGSLMPFPGNTIRRVTNIVHTWSALPWFLLVLALAGLGIFWHLHAGDTKTQSQEWEIKIWNESDQWKQTVTPK